MDSLHSVTTPHANQLSLFHKMPEDSQHSSAWNRHHGVGVTLLDNWVEERAVGERIIQERSNIIELSRQGHAVH